MIRIADVPGLLSYLHQLCAHSWSRCRSASAIAAVWSFSIWDTLHVMMLVSDQDIRIQTFFVPTWLCLLARMHCTHIRSQCLKSEKACNWCSPHTCLVLCLASCLVMRVHTLVVPVDSREHFASALTFTLLCMVSGLILLGVCVSLRC